MKKIYPPRDAHLHSYKIASQTKSFRSNNYLNYYNYFITIRFISSLHTFLKPFQTLFEPVMFFAVPELLLFSC